MAKTRVTTTMEQGLDEETRTKKDGTPIYGVGTKDCTESWTRPTLGTSSNNLEQILLVHQTTNLKTVKNLVICRLTKCLNSYVNKRNLSFLEI